MGCDEDGTTGMTFLNYIPDRTPRQRVQATRRLINATDLRTTDEGDCELKLAHLPARQSFCWCISLFQKVAFDKNVVIVD